MSDNDLRPGMHDHPGLYPTLPPRESSASIDDFASESDPWRTCWEFVLTHQLTEAEGSAFWHGAHLAYEAFHTTPGADQ